MAERHTFAGRTFLTVQETSVVQDHLILTLIREGGIDQVWRDPEEDPLLFGRRLLDTALKSGSALRLLGCLLVPESAVPRQRWGRRSDPGVVWSLEMADETTEFLGQLRDPQDKANVNSLVLSLLISFFETEIISSVGSQTSSRPEVVPTPNQIPTSPTAPEDRGQGSSTGSQTATPTA